MWQRCGICLTEVKDRPVGGFLQGVVRFSTNVKPVRATCMLSNLLFTQCCQLLVQDVTDWSMTATCLLVHGSHVLVQDDGDWSMTATCLLVHDSHVLVQDGDDWSMTPRYCSFPWHATVAMCRHPRLVLPAAFGTVAASPGSERGPWTLCDYLLTFYLMLKMFCDAVVNETVYANLFFGSQFLKLVSFFFSIDFVFILLKRLKSSDNISR